MDERCDFCFNELDGVRTDFGFDKLGKWETNNNKGFKRPSSVSQSHMGSQNETVSVRQPQQGSISKVASVS